MKHLEDVNSLVLNKQLGWDGDSVFQEVKDVLTNMYKEIRIKLQQLQRESKVEFGVKRGVNTSTNI